MIGVDSCCDLLQLYAVAGVKSHHETLPSPLTDASVSIYVKVVEPLGNYLSGMKEVGKNCYFCTLAGKKDEKDSVFIVYIR